MEPTMQLSFDELRLLRSGFLFCSLWDDAACPDAWKGAVISMSSRSNLSWHCSSKSLLQSATSKIALVLRILGNGDVIQKSTLPSNIKTFQNTTWESGIISSPSRPTECLCVLNDCWSLWLYCFLRAQRCNRARSGFPDYLINRRLEHLDDSPLSLIEPRSPISHFKPALLVSLFTLNNALVAKWLPWLLLECTINVKLSLIKCDTLLMSNVVSSNKIYSVNALTVTYKWCYLQLVFITDLCWI